MRLFTVSSLTKDADRAFLGDGLRADLLFGQDAFRQVTVDAPKLVAPHLHGIAERRGAFGISHTRVPTESRPGHVALIGTSILAPGHPAH